MAVLLAGGHVGHLGEVTLVIVTHDASVGVPGESGRSL